MQCKSSTYAGGIGVRDGEGIGMSGYIPQADLAAARAGETAQQQRAAAAEAQGRQHQLVHCRPARTCACCPDCTCGAGCAPLKCVWSLVCTRCNC